jgi:hypothetical protein
MCKESECYDVGSDFVVNEGKEDIGKGGNEE